MSKKLKNNGRFGSGTNHPRWTDLSAIVEELQRMDLGSLLIQPESIKRVNGYRVIDAYCPICTITHTLSVDNIRAGKTSACRCQRAKKYHDPRSRTLGQRYDAMDQRCNRDTHVSSHHYKGRGIKLLFDSREHFIRWALATFQDTDFADLDFDRIDNDGDYCPDNLRLVTRSENLLNRKRREGSNPPRAK